MSELKMPSITLSGNFADMGASLQALRDYVSQASEAAGLEKAAMHRLRLAVDEIATNIISYGYRDAGIEGTLEVKSNITDSSLTISLGDTAPPFDPTQKSDTPDPEAALEDRDMGGWGVYLAISSVDEFRYERIGERNYNHFTMRRQTA